MKRRVTRHAGAGALAGLIVLGVSATPAGAQGGPFEALDKARAVADEASERAEEMDERVGVAPQPTTAEVAASNPRVVTATAPTREPRSRATKRYDPARHRDPFEPPTMPSDHDDTPRTPLERYEIGQLRLVGVVWGGPNNRAMVEDSAGLGYIVTQGTPIGSSGGFVRDIEPTRVLIEETSTNFYGEQEPREVVMELPQEDESP